MKKKICFIAILVMCLIILNIVLVIIFNAPYKKEENTNTEIENKEISKKNTNINENNNTLVVEIENREIREDKQEEKIKDPAELTQEIYNINGPIGTLNIPKTGLNTSIYSSVTVDKMEEMPCFLYTTGGLNKNGTTLFVGHNRRNGTIFSNNKQLQEGDEFFFKDLEGKELRYIVYSKFLTVDSDTSFLNKEVQNPTIALSCCTDDDNEERIIILGEAK